MFEHSILRDIMTPAVPIALDYANRRHRLSPYQKSPGQFVSEADEAIETMIRNVLTSRFGNVPIVGEEHGGAFDLSGTGWVIDPIDGTSNFLRGLPLWGISIGYVEEGRSVAGVIALPDLDLIITGSEKNGVQLNGLNFSRPKSRAGGLVVALGENDYESGADTDIRAQKFRSLGFDVVRYRSAVFSLANAALGRVDGYIEYGCRIWDIAAAEVICAEAGLKIEIGALGNGRVYVHALA